jgi:hypothetical protein
MRHRNQSPPPCRCTTGGKCDTSYCPTIAVTATAEARLPVGSPGWRAADRLAQRSSR